MNELYHYGIPRRSGRYPWGSGDRPFQRLKGSKNSNLEKWGKDKEHNILYITGYSGSGKSHLSKELSNNGKNPVIHLDSYFESVKANEMDHRFNDFLIKNKKYYLVDTILKTPLNERNEGFWKNVDDFMNMTEKFSQKMYPKRKVIIEGVQLFDETVYPNKKFFSDKPIVIMGTSALKSYISAEKRDNKVFTKDLKKMNEYVKRYKKTKVLLKDLSRTANIKKGEKWLKKYLEEAR